MIVLNPLSHPTGPTEIARRERVTKAAQEFEAQLLSCVLGPLEKAFSQAPGQETAPDGDDYAYLGIQALASGLSGSGGIGIANLVSRQLMRTKVEGISPRGEAGKADKVAQR